MQSGLVPTVELPLLLFIYQNITDMPLVIKELHIKITVNQPLQEQHPATTAAASGIAMAENESEAASSRNGGEREREKDDFKKSVSTV
jgi:hypothetical protein